MNVLVLQIDGFQALQVEDHGNRNQEHHRCEEHEVVGADGANSFRGYQRAGRGARTRTGGNEREYAAGLFLVEQIGHEAPEN